jgi:hypothetical protein
MVMHLRIVPPTECAAKPRAVLDAMADKIIQAIAHNGALPLPVKDLTVAVRNYLAAEAAYAGMFMPAGLSGLPAEGEGGGLPPE